MGTNSSFFFQPGIPSRTNPLTPQLHQVIFTGNADALNKIGSSIIAKKIMMIFITEKDLHILM